MEIIDSEEVMSGKIINNGVPSEMDTSDRKNMDKYLTIVLKYKESKNSYPSVMYVMEEIIQAIRHYNSNLPLMYGDSSFDLFGLYVDEDDIERQNIINQEAKNKLES